MIMHGGDGGKRALSCRIPRLRRSAGLAAGHGGGGRACPREGVGAAQRIGDRVAMASAATTTSNCGNCQLTRPDHWVPTSPPAGLTLAVTQGGQHLLAGVGP